MSRGFWAELLSSFSPFRKNNIHRSEVSVQVCSDHHDIHAEIHPQKDYCYDGKTSVNTVGIAIVDIHGKAP